MYVIGIDIGGTKISVCIGNLEGAIFAQQKVPTSTLENPEVGLRKIKTLIGDLLVEQNIEVQDIKAIGLSMPGPVSIKEGIMIAPPNLPSWKKVPIVAYLRREFEKPVFMNNDANAAVLAEWKFGSAKGVDNLIYLTMSTGMGGGIISNGKLLQGATDTAGEVGHLVLDLEGPKCPCGQRGCFEAFCGGKNIADFLKEEIAKKKIQTKICDLVKGDLHAIDMKTLVTAVREKDSYALEVWEKYINRLAQGIGILLMTLNPDAIILGTIAIKNHDLLMKPLKNALSRFSWKEPLHHCHIQESKLGVEIGMIGALTLAIEGLSSFELIE